MQHALPPHAYIPGQTQRHQETQFDEVISTIPSVIDFETLQTLSAFHTALNFMQHGFHWEAHEVLEAMKRETATQKIMMQANALSAEIGHRAPDSVACSEIQKLFLKYAL